MAERIKIDPLDPDPAVVRRAAGIIASGGLVVFPTLGLYGLGADAMNPKAVERVFAAKGRPPEKPVLVLVEGLSDVLELAGEVPETALRLMRAFWPGRLTIVLEAGAMVPEILGAGTGTIGIRAAGHPVARALVAAFGGAVTGTSANAAGSPAPASVDDLSPEIAEAADLVLDAGPLSGEASTVISVIGDKVEILRPGAVSGQRIGEALASAGV